MITKTFKENASSSYQSTWTIEAYPTATTQIVNDSTTGTFTLNKPARVKASFAYTASSSYEKTYARCKIAFSCYAGDLVIGDVYSSVTAYRGDNTGTTSIRTQEDAEYTLGLTTGNIATINISDLWNSSNSTERDVPVYLQSNSIALASSKGDESTGTEKNSYTNNNIVDWGQFQTLRLNAPPTFTASNMGKNTADYYKDDTVVSVTVSDVDCKYGAGLHSVVFTIGEQSTGAPSATTFYIRLNAVGTFTPTVTVTDTRGQATTKTLPAITVGYAPPSCTATPSSSAPYIINYSNYVVGITNATAGSGSISSVKLTVGGQTATGTGNGNLSIPVNTLGTFTPTVVITNSNNVSTTYTLPQITVQNPTPPTFNAQSSSQAPYIRTKSSYAVSITNATASYGGSITQTKLEVGSQSVTGTVSSGSGTLTISSLNTAGTFTPTVTVTDNRGFSTTQSLSAITVQAYNVPSMSLSAMRCTSAGVADNEGEQYILLTTTITYTKAVCNLTDPSNNIIIRNASGTAVSATKAWYSNSSLSTAVNWTNYNPNSPVTLYCLLTGSFSKEQSFTISIYVKDSLNGQSATVSTVVPPAFYTIDCKAGGKEVAFGLPANDTLTSIHGKDVSAYGYFKCGMEAQFDHDAWASGDIVAGGLLKSTAEGHTVKIGSQNSSFCHIYTTAPSVIFDKTVSTTSGDLGTSTYKWGNVFSSKQLIGGYLSYNEKKSDNSHRLASPNITATGKCGITSFIAGSFTTTANIGEGTIIHCEWDNTGGWNSQLFVADNDSGNGKPYVAVRGQRSGTWTSWDRLLAYSDRYTRSSTGGLDWNSGSGADTAVIMKSALAYWDGTYDGSASNLSKCKYGATILSTHYMPHTHSRVDTIPSDGQLTLNNTAIGGSSTQKIAGVICQAQYGSGVIIKHNYDASTNSQVVLNFYKADGSAYSGAMRYFVLTVNNAW